MDQSEVQKSFDKSLVKDNLADLSEEILEIPIDKILKNSVLSELPIVKSVISISKIGLGIHGALFLKKILVFLKGISGHDEEQRKKMITKINNSKKYRLKVGEKLLYIIDSCEDHEATDYIFKLFRALLDKRITYDEFLTTTNVLTRLSAVEIKHFLSLEIRLYDPMELGTLSSSGLFQIMYDNPEVTVVDEDDYEVNKKYKAYVDGGEITMIETREGQIIRGVLNNIKLDNVASQVSSL